MLEGFMIFLSMEYQDTSHSQCNAHLHTWLGQINEPNLLQLKEQTYHCIAVQTLFSVTWITQKAQVIPYYLELFQYCSHNVFVQISSPYVVTTDK